MKPKIIRTERGWAGHFCCAHNCLFRRNTLLEYNNIKIVVSTVGNMIDPISKNKATIGSDNIYYETMAFFAKKNDGYWDADVSKQISFDSPWYVKHLLISSDQNANDMHETVVKELINKLNKKVL